jgi:DNA-directed RNA polymerase specialized sigma24 family protein
VTDLAPDLASRIQQVPRCPRELYRATSADLLRLAVRLTRDPAEAADVVHDVFVGLPAALARYEEQGSWEPGSGG